MNSQNSLRDNIKKAILRKSVISVFLLVALWNLSISNVWLNTRLDGEGAVRETFREIRDTNLHIQMRFYQVLTLGRPIGLSPEDIRLVYIDDQTHWTDQHGSTPTDRAFLASLILNASQAPVSARAIGLDVELLAPRNFEDGDDEDAFLASDLQLRNAIATAANRGVPVVLASTFYPNDEDKNLLLPNIFGPKTLAQLNEIRCLHPRCVSFGYINLPADKRQIPLNEELATGNNSTPTLQDSFSVALAKAVRGPKWVDDALRLSASQSSREEVFGTFLPESSYAYQRT